jgi:alpha-tubulin suppressor-like RCC1 family protein
MLYIPGELPLVLFKIFEELNLNNNSAFNQDIVDITCDMLGANPPNKTILPSKGGSIIIFGEEAKNFDPPKGNDFIKIDCSTDIGVALKTDGSLVSWVHKKIYQRFSCYKDDVHNILNVPKGDDFVDVACGQRHAIALKKNGSLTYYLVQRTS